MTSFIKNPAAWEETTVKSVGNEAQGNFFLLENAERVSDEKRLWQARGVLSNLWTSLHT